MRAAAVLLLLSLPAGAAGLTMPFPAEETLARTDPLSSHRVATGPFAGTLPEVTAEGAVTRRIWRLTGAQTTLQILAPLRDRLVEEGWEPVFECRTRDCGGFDFRFEIDVAPAPEMFVDLADFRYLSARRGEAWITLLVSRSEGFGYVQETRVAPEAVSVPDAVDDAGETATPLAAQADVAAALRDTGRAVLADLAFPTGSTALPEEAYPSLAALADYLEANPDVTVALVGHTDAEGGAASNLAISRRRAESARALLTGTYGIDGARVEAQGVGSLVPLARNDTEDGRRANRRVEAVVTSTGP